MSTLITQITKQPIVYKSEKVITTNLLAEEYGIDSTKIKQNFNNNKEKYTEGIHYYLLENAELAQFKSEVENFDLVASNVNRLYLWTKRGALLHTKSLGTDAAWQTYEMLIDCYFVADAVANSMNALSPQLQALISIELRQNEMEQRFENIKETFAIKKDEVWRKHINNELNKIVRCSDMSHQEVKNYSYKQLEERAHCRLETRLDNMRNRLREQGSSKTRIKDANKLDCIEIEPRLKEIYTSIVRELAVAYAI